MIIRRISLPLLVALALTGCANGGSGDSAGAPAVLPSSAPTSAVPAQEPGTTEPSAGGTRTVTGTITAGVEPGCLLLEDLLLVIDDPEQQAVAKAGATVTATGRVEPGMMSTCQQGTPFIVTTLRAK